MRYGRLPATGAVVEGVFAKELRMVEIVDGMTGAPGFGGENRNVASGYPEKLRPKLGYRWPKKQDCPSGDKAEEQNRCDL